MNIAKSYSDETIEPRIDFGTAIAMIPPPVAHAGMRTYYELGLGRWRAPQCHRTVSFVPARDEWDYCAGVDGTGFYAAGPLVECRPSP